MADHAAGSRQRGRPGGLDDASRYPGLHGTCNVTGTSVTWASGDAFDTSMENKEVVINGVQVLITGYTTDPTYHTVTGLLLASAPGNGTNLPFQIVTMSFRIQRWSLKKDWSVQIEGADRHRFDVRPGRRAQADGRRARPAAGAVLPDSARPGVGAVPGAGGGERRAVSRASGPSIRTSRTPRWPTAARSRAWWSPGNCR